MLESPCPWENEKQTSSVLQGTQEAQEAEMRSRKDGRRYRGAFASLTVAWAEIGPGPPYRGAVVPPKTWQQAPRATIETGLIREPCFDDVGY